MYRVNYYRLPFLRLKATTDIVIINRSVMIVSTATATPRPIITSILKLKSQRNVYIEQLNNPQFVWFTGSAVSLVVSPSSVVFLTDSSKSFGANVSVATLLGEVTSFIKVKNKIS